MNATPDERYPWVQYNSWGYGQEIDEAQQLEAVERCARMGVEVVVLDLGWAAQIGDWRAHPGKFPRGLAPIADRAHELGMKFGVHIPLAQANVSSPVAQQHPDWLIHTGNDYFGAAPICLGHRPCREWLIGELLRMIDAYRLDYLVHDGEDMVKYCPQATHTHAPGDSNYANSEQGLDLVVQTVRQLRPGVVWENCEDGGCMLTYKMARNYHSTITVDNIATYATRQGIYGASYPFSPRYSVRYMQDDPTPYTLRSAIFGGPLILMQQVTEWSEAQMAETRAAITEYKSLRGLVRDAKVVHLLAPRYNVEGIGWGWDAIQAVSADQAHSVVLVHRAVGGPDRMAIRPRGLRPGAIYRVLLVDHESTVQLEGEQLTARGLEIALDELSSEMVRIDLVE
jgi:alpha-galactosidase